MGQFYFYVEAKKVELNLIAIPGGRPQIVRLWVVTFEVDGSVCCSCDFFERVAIVCRHILEIVPDLDESMVDVRWREALGFYFGNPMYAWVTSVIIQALESSLKKIKAGIPIQETSYPVYSDGVNESLFSPFFKRSVKAISHQVPSIYFICLHGRDVTSRRWTYLHHIWVMKRQVMTKWWPIFFGSTSLGASDFHSRLLADTASRRKLKAREAFIAPFRFLCDFSYQSYQYMSFIEN
jgi:hypothetical protein